MKVRRVFKMFGLVGLCLLCSAVLTVPTVQAAKTIRVATVALPETTIYQGLEKWQKVLKEQSKGKLEIKILGRAVMGGDREMIEGCRLNTLDAAVISGSVLATIIPQYFMVAMPYFFNDHKEANAYLDGAPGQKLLGMLNEKDIVGLGWSTWSFRGIWNNVRPITKPEDMQGLKIRTLETPMDMSIVTYMGGISTPMAWSECLLGLRQGTVDGIATTYGLGYALKLYELAKYASQTKHYYEPAPLIMSKKLFEEFTPEEQKIIRKSAAEAMQWTRMEQMKVDEASQKLLEGKGIKVNSLTPEAFNAFRDKTKPVYEQFRAKIGPEFMDESTAFVKAFREKK